MYLPLPPVQVRVETPAECWAERSMSVVTLTLPTIPKEQWGEQKKGIAPGGSRNCLVKVGGDKELRGTFQSPLARQPDPLVVVWLPPVQLQRTQSPCSTTRLAGWKTNIRPSTVVTAIRGTATSTPGSTARPGLAKNGRARIIIEMTPGRFGRPFMALSSSNRLTHFTPERREQLRSGRNSAPP